MFINMQRMVLTLWRQWALTIFGWDFWDKWKFISSGKNGSKYNAVPFVKNDPIELGRLGRLVPGFTKSSTVGERMARVRFLQMVQLIPVISIETKKEEYLRRHSFYSGKFSPSWTVPFEISSGQTGFSIQMVSAQCFPRATLSGLHGYNWLDHVGRGFLQL